MGMEKQQDCPCRGKTLMRFVQPIILAVLWESPCHGYRLIQKIARTKLWYGVTPDPAGIYRTLRDMERRGLIVSQRVLDGGKGHECRSFSITEAGRACHKNWLRTLRRYQAGIEELIQMLDQQGKKPELEPE